MFEKNSQINFTLIFNSAQHTGYTCTCYLPVAKSHALYKTCCIMVLHKNQMNVLFSWGVKTKSKVCSGHDVWTPGKSWITFLLFHINHAHFKLLTKYSVVLGHHRRKTFCPDDVNQDYKKKSDVIFSWNCFDCYNIIYVYVATLKLL